MPEVVSKKYKGGYVARFKQTELFCLVCGARGVWIEDDDIRLGDDDYICPTNGCTFEAYPPENIVSARNRDMLILIRAALAAPANGPEKAGEG